MRLQDYGFIFPRRKIAKNVDEAASLSKTIGFPVVMKISSLDILHKTDIGGVELGLCSEEDVRAAYLRILRNVEKHAPQARVEGILVEEMCENGTEIIIGLNNDQQFGPVIMFGLGGIFTEVLNDISFRVLPITHEDALSMIREIKGQKILGGYRGKPPISINTLVTLLMKVSDLGLEFADTLRSVDLNPIVVWENEHRVLDAKILLGNGSIQIVENKPNISYLDLFFKARSVALVGATATPGKIGNFVLDSLVNHDYQGKVYPVNPKCDEVKGFKSYPSISSIPECVDLVVVAIPLLEVPDLIQECAEKGIHNMIIISGGGKELGGESKELEALIKRLASVSDLRIIGCNCIGVFDGETRLDTFFQVHERMDRPRNGCISMITQSGTVGAAFLESARHIGISKFVSYGNRIDVDEADLITYLVDDKSTEVIVCYIEGFEYGKKFFAAAREATRKKPVVIYKAGRTHLAATTAVSHTGFFGGSYNVVQGAMKQAGAITVDSFEELYSVSKALALQSQTTGNKVAMISNGAGTLIQAIDLLESSGLEMADLSPETVADLRKIYPAYFVVQNPIDITGSAKSRDYEVGIEHLLQDTGVDIVMPWFVFQDTPLEENIVSILGNLNRSYDKPILVGAIGGSFTIEMSKAIELQGVPVFNSVREWISAAGALVNKQPY